MLPRRKLLVVDDNHVNRRVLCKILESEYDTLEAENGVQALDILARQSKSIALILLDIVMPVMDGYTFLREFKNKAAYSGIPVVVTTQQDSESDEIEALAAGASDFLTKPYKPQIIKHRVAALIKLRETAAIIDSVERDQLTHLYSKEFFYNQVRRRMEENPDESYDLVTVDIQRFKVINDLFGTAEGDRLLQRVAANVQEMAGAQNVCGRLGADVFAFMVPHRVVWPDEVFSVLASRVNEHPISINIELRFGIYVIDDPTLPVSAMCDRALLAMATIKGRYDALAATYDSTLRERMLQEQRITDTMRASLANNEFRVYLQPKYELESDRIAGAEALVRWFHPTLGFMSPGEFIPLFERNGFISELDCYMWEATCCKLHEWLKKGHPAIPVSVNVSRADIYNPQLPQILSNLIEQYELKPEYLHLEITETAYTENSAQLIEAVRQLKERGFVIEMDDFGSGYSSLNMLGELPIDILKMDMRFIQNSERSHGRSILAFIISLAKWMGLAVVAEGVETQEQIDMLRNMDCDYVQGFYYAKPMPCSDFEELMATTPICQRKEHHLEEPLAQAVEHGGDDKRVMLVVDDVELNRAALRGFFEDSFKVVEADNGATAMEYIRSHREQIAIILLDLLMPIMDGFKMIEQLKADPATAGIPIVVTTVSGQESEERCLDLGVDDFIVKPYRRSLTCRRVENVLARAREKAEDKKAI